MLAWSSLLLSERRRKSENVDEDEFRTQIERDFDRILYSTPVRRLADKTQVFPLERNDSVRTRLTHSHEVANLARSIGTYLVNRPRASQLFGGRDGIARDVPALLAALGLVHDIGNPPFGHQGELAIRHWFEKKRKEENSTLRGLSRPLLADFLKFEGNAQTFRLVSRLQMRNDDFGLNLTYGTLGALLKYTVPAQKSDQDSEYAGGRKPGFFASERSIVNEVRKKTGLSEFTRHPLTYVVEACDDIAYSVIDAEDAVKKGIASFPDLKDFLMDHAADKKDPTSNALVREVLDSSDAGRKKLRDPSGKLQLSPAEYNDHSMQIFRTHAISRMIRAVTKTYEKEVGKLLRGTFKGDLIKASEAATLARRLKNFDYAVAYRHRSVLGIELEGFRIIQSLMDAFWNAIISRDNRDASTENKRSSPSSAYVYGVISENYRRIFESKENSLPIRYREAQLLCDMIAGMTDSYAVALHKDFVDRGILKQATFVA